MIALGKNFSSKPLGPLVIEFFSGHTTRCKIIFPPALYAIFFFSVSRGIFLR